MAALELTRLYCRLHPLEHYILKSWTLNQNSVNISQAACSGRPNYINKHLYWAPIGIITKHSCILQCINRYSTFISRILIFNPLPVQSRTKVKLRPPMTECDSLLSQLTNKNSLDYTFHLSEWSYL